MKYSLNEITLANVAKRMMFGILRKYSRNLTTGKGLFTCLSQSNNYDKCITPLKYDCNSLITPFNLRFN